MTETLKVILIKPLLSKKSIFAKNFEIEINTWGDSPSSALSETLLIFSSAPHF